MDRIADATQASANHLDNLLEPQAVTELELSALALVGGGIGDTVL
jgi:hypothetical protein